MEPNQLEKLKDILKKHKGVNIPTGIFYKKGTVIDDDILVLTNGLNGNEEGHIFVGNINEDLKREGEGKTYFKHGGSFHGIWANDRLNGLGILYSDKKEIVYKGNWKDDQPHGEGIYFFRNGIIYRGDYSDGEQEGTGELLSPNGCIYRGEFVNGRKEGKGLFFNSIKKKVVVGVWKADRVVMVDKVIDVNDKGDKTNEKVVEHEIGKKSFAEALEYSGFFEDFNQGVKDKQASVNNHHHGNTGHDHHGHNHDDHNHGGHGQCGDAHCHQNHGHHNHEAGNHGHH